MIRRAVAVSSLLKIRDAGVAIGDAARTLARPRV
jgi:hypothetical protein